MPVPVTGVFVEIKYNDAEGETSFSYPSFQPTIPNIGDWIMRDEGSESIPYEVQKINHHYMKMQGETISHIITVLCNKKTPRKFGIG